MPIAPEPLLRRMLDLAELPTTSTAVRFTLPFGIKAVASLGAERRPLTARPRLALNQPFFGPLVGGLQFALHGASPDGIPGGAIQTKNSVTVPPKSVLDDEVDGFFNVAFHPGDTVRRIPLSRVDLSGYGESGEYASMKAYDLLVQAESGLCSVTGRAEGPGRVGVSACDIACGMNAHAAVLEALIARGITGRGTGVAVSLFARTVAAQDLTSVAGRTRSPAEVRTIR